MFIIVGHSVGGMRGLFRRLVPCTNRHELSLDGWTLLERVLCHRLESSPHLPAPAACTPLETNQQTSELNPVRLLLVSAAKVSL